MATMKRTASAVLVIAASFALALPLTACSKKDDAKKTSATKSPAGKTPAKADPTGDPKQPPAGGTSETVARVGHTAPDFTAKAHTGETITLSKLKGQPVVLYFYPKDDTPGCTAEANAFRDGIEDFNKVKARVFGISFDDTESHKHFAEKYKLNFPLLTDVGEITKKYGVRVTERPAGCAADKKATTCDRYADRVTFVIDKTGKIAHKFPMVRVSGHADEVLKILTAL
jgi:peroxiredoxin Q/BCP